MRAALALSWLVVGAAALGCSGGESAAPSAAAASSAGAAGGPGGGAGEAGAAGAAGGAAGAPCGPDPTLPEEEIGTGSDPTGGKFSLDDALAGLPEGPGPLRAEITTDLGKLVCTLRPDAAPIGVASFVGLARGTRPFRDAKKKLWVKRRFYDGLLFHRVIPGFMAQGGDQLGTGIGSPGYKLPDEISLPHIAGALAYANAGPNTAGSQFYVTETEQPGLDGMYTVFGACEPVSVVTALTHVETTGKDGDPADKPLVDLHVQTVRITRCAASP